MNLVNFRSWFSFCCLSASSFENAISSSMGRCIFWHVALPRHWQSIRLCWSDHYYNQRRLRLLGAQISQTPRSVGTLGLFRLLHSRSSQYHGGKKRYELIVIIMNLSQLGNYNFNILFPGRNILFPADWLLYSCHFSHVYCFLWSRRNCVDLRRQTFSFKRQGNDRLLTKPLHSWLLDGRFSLSHFGYMDFQYGRLRSSNIQ